MSGDATWVSIQRKTARSATAAPSRPSVWPESQPAWLPFTIAYTASISAPVTVTAPPTSSRPPAAEPPVVGSSRSASTTTRTPIGKLTRKIQCQLIRSVRTPPSRTPRLPPPAATKPKMPIAFCAVRRLGEEVHHQRERDGRGDRAAEALHRSRGDEHPLRRGEAADKGRGGEEGDARKEQPPVPEEVAEPAAEQEKASVGEQVGVHDPGQGGLGEVQVLADRRQRDVHDRGVEHDHQAREGERVEREPAGAALHCHRRLLSSVTHIRPAAPTELIARTTDDLRPRGRSYSRWPTSAPSIAWRGSGSPRGGAGSSCGSRACRESSRS